MQRVKVTEGSWKGQEGEFVRHNEAAGNIVARMAGSRLVEFKPEHVDFIVDEPEAKTEE